MEFIASLSVREPEMLSRDGFSDGGGGTARVKARRSRIRNICCLHSLFITGGFTLQK
jgi:hypothetical protein